MSLLLCLGADSLPGSLVTFTAFGDHGENVVAGCVLMAYEPATNDCARPPDAAPAVHIDANTGSDFPVKVVKDSCHLVDSRDSEIRYFKSTNARSPADCFVVAHEMFVGPTGAVLGEVDKVANPSRKQQLDCLKPIARRV